MLFFIEHTNQAGQVSRHFIEADNACDAHMAALDALGQCVRLICKKVAGMSAADRARYGLPADLPVAGGASCE